MFSDLLTFTTPKLRRASMMVALLQLILKKGGNLEDARRLEGLDVTNAGMAAVAIEILSGLRVHNDKEFTDTRDLALSALQDALRPEAYLLHAAN